MINRDLKCAEVVEESLAKTLKNLAEVWKGYCTGEDEESFLEYGLAFSYTPSSVDEEEGYFTYLLSWGGPSTEFRFYTNHKRDVNYIEYWHLDWNDGASIQLEGESEKLLLEIFDFFKDIGTVGYEYDKAVVVVR